MAIRLYGQLVMITFMISMLLSLGGCTGDEHFADTGSVSGVVSTESGEAIEGALIRANGSELRTVTNIHGEFTLNLPEGSVELSAASENYLSTSKKVNVLRGQFQKIYETMTMIPEAKNDNEAVTLKLRTLADAFTTSQCVMATMEVKNNSTKSIVISNWYIEVTDERGQLVYKTNIESPSYTVAPDSIVGKTENWEWYNGENRLPIIIGNNLTITALATVKPLAGNIQSQEDQRQQLISPPIAIKLTNEYLGLKQIPYVKVEEGGAHLSIQNSGCIINSRIELEEFLRTNNETISIGDIDFNSEILLGVAGSKIQKQPYRVSVEELKTISPYRFSSKIADTATPKTTTQARDDLNPQIVICTVADTSSSLLEHNYQSEPEDSMLRSAWQLVRVDRKTIGDSTVEFVWRDIF